MIEEAVATDWGNLLNIAIALITIGGAVWGVWWALHKRISDEREARILATNLISVQLAEFKIQVAQNYATQQSIMQVEERVVQAIERLGDRLDRFLENRPRSRS